MLSCLFPKLFSRRTVLNQRNIQTPKFPMVHFHCCSLPLLLMLLADHHHHPLHHHHHLCHIDQGFHRRHHHCHLKYVIKMITEKTRWTFFIVKLVFEFEFEIYWSLGPWDLGTPGPWNPWTLGFLDLFPPLTPPHTSPYILLPPPISSSLSPP